MPGVSNFYSRKLDFALNIFLIFRAFFIFKRGVIYYVCDLFTDATHDVENIECYEYWVSFFIFSLFFVFLIFYLPLLSKIKAYAFLILVID